MSASRSRASAPAAILLVLMACATTAETNATMYRHFEAAREMRTAVLFGRVDDAREAADALRRERPMPGLSATDPLLLSLYHAADSVASVDSPRELAPAIARLALACGDCHVQKNAGPVFATGAPREATDLQTHMIVYSWGAARMWEALISRSERAWRSGAQALIADPIADGEFLPRVEDAGTATNEASDVQRIAQRSLMTSDYAERASLLAELWSSCAGCHALAR